MKEEINQLNETIIQNEKSKSGQYSIPVESGSAKIPLGCAANNGEEEFMRFTTRGRGRMKGYKNKLKKSFKVNHLVILLSCDILDNNCKTRLSM